MALSFLSAMRSAIPLNILNTRLLFLVMTVFFQAPVWSKAPLQVKGDINLRVDHRTLTHNRYQYRLRQFIQQPLENNWSAHGFISTGNRFSSSHNTLSHSSNQKLNLRRLYLRHQDESGKTELGVIPTYKGRVSSTGLSKHGWISGVRQVFQRQSGQIEWVGGYLADHAPGIFRQLKGPNYFEVEYSSHFADNWSFEVAAEHMVSDNFIRGEVRYMRAPQMYYSFEVVHRPDNNQSKLVLSAELPTPELSHSALFSNSKLFAYYSYVGQEFGARAALTEDFIGFGHGLSLELKGNVSLVKDLGWFLKSEFYSKQNRYQAGLKYRF